MPRKDPMTGVMVMTTAEFFEKEAARVGRTGADLMAETLQEIDAELDADSKRMSAQFRAEALKHLESILEDEREYFESDPPRPVRVLSCDLNCDYAFTGYLETFQMLVLCADGKRYNFTYRRSHDNGNYWQPPDDDTELNWLEVSDSTEAMGL